jgi:hypothetical protein
MRYPWAVLSFHNGYEQILSTEIRSNSGVLWARIMRFLNGSYTSVSISSRLRNSPVSSDSGSSTRAPTAAHSPRAAAHRPPLGPLQPARPPPAFPTARLVCVRAWPHTVPFSRRGERESTHTWPRARSRRSTTNNEREVPSEPCLRGNDREKRDCKESKGEGGARLSRADSRVKECRTPTEHRENGCRPHRL